MFSSTLVTGPSFLGGILLGLNRRNHPNFKHDPFAHYKLLSLTSVMGFVTILGYSNEIPTTKLTSKQLFASAICTPPLLTGVAFCTGLMLTKISEKESL